MTQRNVLVTGATGQQGGQVARNLAATGHTVTALVRDPDSAKAASLRELGVQTVKGDFSDAESLSSALMGIDSVFAVGTPFGGIEAEIAQGKALVDASAEAGISHFVYSSVASADKNTGIPHFDSKSEVERHVVASGLNRTITAPVFFMDNTLFPWNVADMKRGVFRQALAPDTRLQQISVGDIGRLNAAVISEGERFYGRRIEIAADELTGTDMAAGLASASGLHLAYEAQPLEEVKAQFADMALMYEWFENTGFSVDFEALKGEFPGIGLTRFADWAASMHWRDLLAA